MKTKGKGSTGRKRVALPGAKHAERKRTANKRKPKARRKREATTRFGLKVTEAKADMNIALLQVDIDKAEASKPAQVNDEDTFLTCVIAQAVTRACGAGRVEINRRVAYVAFPGEEVTRRYEVTPHSREVLEAWDRGEEVKEGVELCLKAPSKSRTRKYMAKKIAEYREHNPEGKGRKTNRKQRSSDPLDHQVRNGNLVRWS